jgi:hypothetical protein
MYVRGRVVDDPLGRPIPGATVSVYEVRPDEGPRPASEVVGLRSATTDAGGVFAIRYWHCFGVDCRFMVTKEGFEPSDLSEREASAVGGGLFVGSLDRRTLTTIRLTPSGPRGRTGRPRPDPGMARPSDD